MPDSSPTPPDGGTGPTPPAPPTPPVPPKKLDLTQEDLDRIIAERVARAVPKDYEELKALKAEKDEAAEKEKTDLQKAKDEAKLEKDKGSQAITRAHGILKRAAILAEAAAQGAVDSDTVITLLSGSEDIAVDKDDNVTGAKAAVTKLLKDKPFLGKGKLPGAGGGEFGGNDQRTLAERIKELETAASQATDIKVRRAKLEEARDLKMQQAFGAK